MSMSLPLQIAHNMQFYESWFPLSNGEEIKIVCIGYVWYGDGTGQGGTGQNRIEQDMTGHYKLFCIVFGRSRTELLAVLLYV